MPTRRQLLRLAAQMGIGLTLLPYIGGRARGSVLVNDVHSQLNPTEVDSIVTVESEAHLRETIAGARERGKPVSIAGGRHSMGGQQFAAGGVLIDTRSMRRILGLDAERGIVEIEAGIEWPGLIDGLIALQQGQPRQWGIIQKQTGADRLTLGGALASNIHGRGLTFKPIVGDVESFTLMDAKGALHDCSRTENEELFRLAIGGYGLFGVVTRVKLRLMPRTKLERIVKLIDVEALMPAFDARIADGFLYGDCQFSTDPSSDTYLRTGVFSCYRPLPPDTPMPEEAKELGEQAWRDLYYLSHADPKATYDIYTAYYLSTSGQRYWSDLSQLGVYIDDYHAVLDAKLNAPHKGSEMISELYVPRDALTAFLTAVRADFKVHGTKLIYGTIRLIERDDESVLAWAREPWACTVMNLHVDHSEAGIEKAGEDFRRLIDRAIEHGGSYFLTYHRWASRAQVEACYPQMPEFLAAKRRYDPGEVFQTEWYRHYRQMFPAAL
ncbi:MAG: FAD-binding oxidoreductase [Methyloceanibacter sp.]